MIRFVTIIVFVHFTLCQETRVLNKEHLMIVNNQKFKNCSAWTWEEYKNVGISAPSTNFSGLRSNVDSCASVTIFLKPRSILNFVVFVKTDNLNSGIVILVTVKENGLIASFAYNRATDNFDEGWIEISLQIDKGGLAYIDLLGYSRDNEIVLVDSVSYTNNSTQIDTNTDKGFVIIDEKHKEISIRQNEDNNHSNKNDKRKSFEEETNDYSRLEKALFRDTNDDDFNTLGTWAIILISLGCVTITALVVVCAYYIGKFRATPKLLPVVYDVEPPKVDILPRVRGTVEPFQYNFES